MPHQNKKAKHNERDRERHWLNMWNGALDIFLSLCISPFMYRNWIALLQNFLLFFQEGRTIVESKTADIIQETRKLQNKRRGNNYEEPNRASNVNNSWQQSLNQPTQPQLQTNHETQIKASRDVRCQPCNFAWLVLVVNVENVVIIRFN